jgi:uncharacterized protein (TIGR02145 family)
MDEYFEKNIQNMLLFEKYFKTSVSLFLLLLLFFINSCKKDSPEPPSITTTTITDISSTSAIGGGIITSNGGAPVLSKGITWSTDENPTIESNSTLEGNGSGSFRSTISSLKPATLYYVRAYATNIAGISYGNQTSFNTYDRPGLVLDGESNAYGTVVIGNQTWMTENLKATKYRNGIAIPMVTSAIDWYYLKSPAYCIYGNSKINKTDYGVLYNWYTIDAGQDGNMNICPTGWHVPTDSEWSTLMNFLGGDSAAVGKLKETGLNHWLEGNTDATNETGFSARPGGVRDFDGTFIGLGYYGGWWSSTEFVEGGALCRYLGYDGSGGFSWGRFEQDGFSVRCLKNSDPLK